MKIHQTLTSLREKGRWALGALVFFACLMGGLAALVGGFAVTLVTAVLVGVGTLAFFIFFSKKDTHEPEAHGIEAHPVPTDEIPSDRIDSLTGLANENGLLAWFSEKGSRVSADGKGIIVLSADLAEFERVEKAYGKEIVEAVLIEVARRVSTCTGDDGIAARTAGDEFVAIATVVPNHSEEVAAEQAGKLAELIQRPVELSSGVVWIGGSVGAAYGPVSEGSAVLQRSREALTSAKRLGRGHYVVSKP